MTDSLQLPDNWSVFEDPDAVADATVELILKTAQQSISERGVFHFVTAGGTTPMQVYKKLAEKSHEDYQWDKWHLYIGDERCLPVNDSERNSLALQQAWLQHSSIPKAQWHFMTAELGAEHAAKQYETLITGLEFDLVLLGMGEDGHTASLFPGHAYSLQASSWVITEFDSPKPPSERVSLSLKAFKQSRHVVKLITGVGKRAAIKQWLQGEPLPISVVEGQQTEVLISKDALPK